VSGVTEDKEVEILELKFSFQMMHHHYRKFRYQLFEKTNAVVIKIPRLCHFISNPLLGPRLLCESSIFFSLALINCILSCPKKKPKKQKNHCSLSFSP
jgi:hypothetical protein